MNNELEEFFVEMPWGKIAVLCRGQKDGEPVVMLHGNLDSAGTFFPLIKYIPKKFRIYMIELPGCGKSSPLPSGQPLHILDFLPAIKMTIDHFNLDKFTFIGHSMGSQLGLLFNAVYTDHIVKFISLDHLAYPPMEPESFNFWYMMSYGNFYEPSNYKKYNAGPAKNPLYTYDEALSNVIKTRKLTKEAGECVLQRTLIPAENGLFRFCWDQRYKVIGIPILTTEFQLELFGKINVPHMHIFATESVNKRIHEVKTHLLERYLATNPNYRVVLVEGCHDVHMNEPKVIGGYIVPFLNGEYGSRNDNIKTVNFIMNTYKKKGSKL